MATLVRLRKEKGLTQGQIAEMIGVDQTTVSRFEQADSNPQLSMIRRYARAVGARVRHEATPMEPNYRERIDAIMERVGKDLYGSYGQVDITWLVAFVEHLLKENEEFATEHRMLHHKISQLTNELATEKENNDG